MKQHNWKDVYEWFAKIINSDAGKIENLSDKGYDNWLLSLFYLAGVDKIDPIMRKKEGVEAIQNAIEIAYHEAGHAIFFWRHGWDFGKFGVYINPLYRGGICTLPDFKLMKQLFEREWREDSLVLKPMPPHEAQIEVAMAGVAAQNIFRKYYSLRPATIKFSKSDYYSAIYHAKRMRYSSLKKREAEKMVKAMYAEVYYLLTNPRTWAAVTAIAEALLTHGFLKHETVIKIISQINPPCKIVSSSSKRRTHGDRNMNSTP
jgi:hypothetical protein